MRVFQFIFNRGKCENDTTDIVLIGINRVKLMIKIYLVANNLVKPIKTVNKVLLILNYSL